MTHRIGIVGVDLAVLDSYVSTPDEDSAALQRTSRLHQRGVVVGPLFETGVCAHIWSLIVVDDAIIDVHSATPNGNAPTL